MKETRRGVREAHHVGLGGRRDVQHAHARIVALPQLLAKRGNQIKPSRDAASPVHYDGREDKNRHCQDHEGLSLHNRGPANKLRFRWTCGI